MSGSTNNSEVWPWDVYQRDRDQAEILSDWLDNNPFPLQPDPYGKEAETAKLAEQKRLRTAMGYASTVLNGGQGLGAARTTARTGGY